MTPPGTWHGAPQVLGMPMLCALGLSENWLLKACGERHWQALAEAAGCPTQAMHDAAGRRLYAAFTEVTLRHGALGRAHEGDVLHLHGSLAPLDRARWRSLHRASIGAGVIAEVEMASVFVARSGGSADNQRIVRSELRRAAGRGPDTPAVARPRRPRPVPAEPARVLATQQVRPCPKGDFNGAGLLYFASFQALVDRALWTWGLPCERLGTAQRQMRFHGNLNLGDTLHIELLQQRALSQGGYDTHVQLRRGSDGQHIADVHTRGAPPAPCAMPCPEAASAPTA